MTTTMITMFFSNAFLSPGPAHLRACFWATATKPSTHRAGSRGSQRSRPCSVEQSHLCAGRLPPTS